MNKDLISRRALKNALYKVIEPSGIIYAADVVKEIDNAQPIETTIDTLMNTLSVETLKATTWVKVDTPSGESFVYKREETGQWIELKTDPPFLDHRFYICSKCGREIDVITPDESLDDYPYCHCGAHMLKETEL